MLKISNLNVMVERTRILRGVDFEVKAGEVHAIMGLNGSGKSTLVKTLAGHPHYEVTAGNVDFMGTDLLELEPDERAKAGLFLAFQYPHAVPGVTVANFLRTGVNAIRKAKNGGEDDPIKIPAFRKQLGAEMERLKVRQEKREREKREEKEKKLAASGGLHPLPSNMYK